MSLCAALAGGAMSDKSRESSPRSPDRYAPNQLAFVPCMACLRASIFFTAAPSCVCRRSPACLRASSGAVAAALAASIRASTVPVTCSKAAPVDGVPGVSHSHGGKHGAFGMTNLSSSSVARAAALRPACSSSRSGKTPLNAPSASMNAERSGAVTTSTSAAPPCGASPVRQAGTHRAERETRAFSGVSHA